MLIDKMLATTKKWMLLFFSSVACNWQLPISEREEPEVTSIVLQQEKKQQLYQKKNKKANKWQQQQKNEELMSDSHLQKILPTNRAQLTGKDINFKTQQN